MHHGDILTILPEGIRISEQEIAPLGINDDSICWAKWLPDRRAKSKISHLIISPFDVSSWPTLFRIRLLLNEGSGTLNTALNILREHEFNILAIEGTPSGHHHYVVNIIGEAIRFRSNSGILTELSHDALSDHERNFRNQKLREHIHKYFAPAMLRFSIEIEKALMGAHKKKKFLRETFLFQKEGVELGFLNPLGSLYNPQVLEGADLRNEGFKQSPTAVQCQWLQNHAFFWLFGTSTKDESNILRFHANKHELKPELNWLHDFKSKIKSLSPPFKCISNLNYHEHYIRLAFSENDKPNRTYKLHLPYTATYESRIATKGLLSSVVRSLSDGDVLIRSVSMSTQTKQPSIERGSFTFLTSLNKNFDSHLGGTEVFISELAKNGFQQAKNKMERLKCILNEDTISVEPHSVKFLFLSTNFKWLYTQRKNLLGALKKSATAHGFTLLIGDESHLSKECSYLWNSNRSLTENILSLIRKCDAFLQIIPQSVVKESGGQGDIIWLLFESGGAHSLEIPCEICVDTSGGFDISSWNERLKTSAGRHVNSFNGMQGDSEILSVFDKAIASLATRERQNFITTRCT